MATATGGRIVQRPFVAVAMVLVVSSFIAACSAGPSTPLVSPNGSSSPGSSSVPGSSSSPAVRAVSTRIPPNGATAPIDDDAWLIAERLAAPTYTTDTTAAAVAGLARSGIGTYADPSSRAPDQPVAGAGSPLRLLDFQTHALAVGAWTGSTFRGAELDTVLPADPTPGMPTTSDILAAYVAATDSPGAALSRALMAGRDLLSPSTLRFPTVVLELFASDIATDGGTLTGAVGGTEVVALASGGVCSDAKNWVEGTITSLFNLLKLATPDNVPLAVLASAWNWLVTKGESLVNGLISSVTSAVLGTVRSIAGVIATVAEQIVSLVPYGLKVRAVGGSGGTFMLGPDPLPGTFTASVSVGDLPDWPAVMADCAAVAKVSLADLHGANKPIIWGPLEAPADPKIAQTGSADIVTDANGQANWAFVTSTDPGDPNGEQQNQQDSLPVTIHNPVVESARDHLNAALLGFIPAILQSFVSSVLSPYLRGLQARLNALLDARGTGTAWIVYHSPAPPTPVPSGPCSPSPVPAATYTGTTTGSSSEIIDLGASGGVVATGNAAGKASIVVAADGSLSGTWDMTSNDVFDETAAVNGVVGLKEHRVSTTSYSGAVIGTACDLELTYGAVVVVSCVSSLTGDCTDQVPPTGPSPAPGGFGRPSSVSGGHVTWTFHYASNAGAQVVYDLIVSVSCSAP